MTLLLLLNLDTVTADNVKETLFTYWFLSSLKLHLEPVKLMLIKYTEKTMAIIVTRNTAFCGHCVMEEIQRAITQSILYKKKMSL